MKNNKNTNLVKVGYYKKKCIHDLDIMFFKNNKAYVNKCPDCINNGLPNLIKLHINKNCSDFKRRIIFKNNKAYFINSNDCNNICNESIISNNDESITK